MNNKKLSIGIIVFVLIVLGLFVLGRSGPGDDAPVTVGDNGVAGEPVQRGMLSVDKGSFDFGMISMANGKVAQGFAITNTGESAVTITKIYTSCMCTTVELALGDKVFGPYGMPGHGMIPSTNAVLEPGAQGNIQVVFDPAAHGPAGIGTVTRVVYVETKESGTLELSISATVTP